jgi:hypothetical protein
MVLEAHDRDVDMYLFKKIKKNRRAMRRRMRMK